MNNTIAQQTFSESDVRKIICDRDMEWFQVIESIVGFHPVSITDALYIGVSCMKNKNERIKRLQDWVDNLEQGHSHSGKNDNREWHGSEIGWLVPGQIVYIGEAKLMKMTYE